MDPDTTGTLSFLPLTPARWPDLERLFGPRGAYGGCWCMWWRLTRREFEANRGEGNRRALQSLVKDGDTPGLLAYAGEEPVGWCAVAPREAFGAVLRSPVLRPADGRPAWSIVCLYVHPAWRGRGLTVELARAAVAHVRRRGGTLVEAYPTAPRGRRLPPVSSYMGVPDIFRRAGFEEHARPSAARVIMRRALDDED